MTMDDMGEDIDGLQALARDINCYLRHSHDHLVVARDKRSGVLQLLWMPYASVLIERDTAASMRAVLLGMRAAFSQMARAAE